MTADLDHLWALHGIDAETLKLEQELTKFPAQREALAKAVAEAKAKVLGLQSRAAEVVKQRRELEREVEGVDTQEKKFLGQQAAVKTNAEFQALTHEIGRARERRSELETKILLAMDDEERAAVERPVLEGALREAEADRDNKERAFAGEEAALRARLDGLQARREVHVHALTPATRPRYERLRASRGMAVVPIAKGACGGCFRTLPPQALMEAKKRDRLLYCDGCGRILVLPPDEPAA